MNVITINISNITLCPEGNTTHIVVFPSGHRVVTDLQPSTAPLFMSMQKKKKKKKPVQ
jgi:hypothetical protein